MVQRGRQARRDESRAPVYLYLPLASNISKREWRAPEVIAPVLEVAVQISSWSRVVLRGISGAKFQALHCKC